MAGAKGLSIPYVGYEAPVLVIPAGSLVRVSLARWWHKPNAPDEGETCSLQLSGWFGLPADTLRAQEVAPPPPTLSEDDIPY